MSIVTAAILVIGDEILSGRTKDKNIGYIAEYLTNIGIDLKEVRVVSDDEQASFLHAQDRFHGVLGALVGTDQPQCKCGPTVVCVNDVGTKRRMRNQA